MQVFEVAGQLVQFPLTDRHRGVLGVLGTVSKVAHLTAPSSTGAAIAVE